MQLGTKEFYELMDIFEKTQSKNILTGSMGLKREDKELWDKKRYYCDGNANDFFKMFICGYSLGKTSNY